MKKTYIAPCVKVQKIDATQMICESLGFGGSYSGGTVGTKDRGSRQSDDDDFDDLW